MSICIDQQPFQIRDWIRKRIVRRVLKKFRDDRYFASLDVGWTSPYKILPWRKDKTSRAVRTRGVGFGSSSLFVIIRERDWLARALPRSPALPAIKSLCSKSRSKHTRKFDHGRFSYGPLFNVLRRRSSRALLRTAGLLSIRSFNSFSR
jgi:hypothetical protein